ncbi:MAG: hypothetical protein AAFZ18_02670 [Myxococcota bacterium]
MRASELPPPAALRLAGVQFDLAHAPEKGAFLSSHVDAIIERAERTLSSDPEGAVDDLLAADAVMLQGPDGEAHEARLAEAARRLRSTLPMLAAVLELHRARSTYLRGGYERCLSIVLPLSDRFDALRGFARSHVHHRITDWPPNPLHLKSCAVAMRSAAERALGRHDVAARRCAELEREMTGVGLVAGQLNARVHHGLALIGLGQLEAAEEKLRTALPVALSIGAFRMFAFQFSELGVLAEQQGDTALALGWTLEARHRLELQGDRLFVGKLLAREAQLLDALGRVEEASARAERAHQLAVLCGDFETQTHVVTNYLERRSGETSPEVEARQAARRQALSWALSSMGYAHLERRIDLSAAASSGPRLCVTGSRVAVTDGGHDRVVELGSRPVLRRIMARLIDAKARGRPGVSVEELVSTGWPGQRPTHESGRNRVYASIRLLRRLGLEDVIQHGEGGYYLTLPVVRS